MSSGLAYEWLKLLATAINLSRYITAAGYLCGEEKKKGLTLSLTFNIRITSLAQSHKNKLSTEPSGLWLLVCPYSRGRQGTVCIAYMSRNTLTD
jgi:hypothetical protein